MTATAASVASNGDKPGNDEPPFFTFQNLAPGHNVIPKPLIDTSLLPMSVVDARIWPTPYVASRLRMHIATNVVRLLESEFESSVEVDKVFLMLERPKREEHGHYCLPVPQLRLTGVNPVQAAMQLAQSFTKDSTGGPNQDAVKIEAVSTGPFVNFRVDTAYIVRSAVGEALQWQGVYGHCDFGSGRRVGIDYSSPNIAKPFHAGHIRSTIIGNFVKMVYAAGGFAVLGINYLGDWGKQYGLLAVGFERYGDEQALVEDPIKHLFDIYVRVNRDMDADPSVGDTARAYFRSMEEGDEKALSLWRRFRDLSIIKYRQVYDRLNVQFELFSGESLYQEAMPRTIALLDQGNLMQTTEAAKTIDLEAWKLGRPLIMKRDGATLYMTRDIAAAQHRFEEYKLAKSIYVVAMQQDLHLAQLFKIIELMGEKGLVPASWHHDMLHINFGMVKGMRTRKGEVVFLEDILDDARDTMHAVMQASPEKYAEIADPVGTSDTLAVSAIVVQDMAAKRIKDYDFKLERVMQFEGDTGPYLQYAHSRLCSIARKSGLSISDTSTVKWELLTEREAADLAWHIARFPDTLQEARITFEPCTLVSYLMALSQTVSQCLNKLWVMGQPEDVARARLALYTAARITLGNGLRVIGLRPLERM